jgi:hypothetical protein
MIGIGRYAYSQTMWALWLFSAIIVKPTPRSIRVGSAKWSPQVKSSSFSHCLRSWATYSHDVMPLSPIWCTTVITPQAGKSSSFMGPIVSSAISDHTTSIVGKYNTPFAFLFALGAISCGLLLLVDVEKARKECEEFRHSWLVKWDIWYGLDS